MHLEAIAKASSASACRQDRTADAERQYFKIAFVLNQIASMFVLILFYVVHIYDKQR